MSDYKDTLNLPKTDFPMKASLGQREPEILKKWQQIHLYQALRQQDVGREKFILQDGPPYANGHIHMGTAVNKILKDIIIKAKTLSGYAAAFIPGWDCHGLPIELNVEKKLGKPGHKVSVREFRQACRDYAKSQMAIQREEFKRLGVIADWDHPYLTMDFSFEANVIRSLKKMIERGHVQRGAKPVYWCLDCASALAIAEVEYADKTSPAVDVRFNAVDVSALAKIFQCSLKSEARIALPIWTTTPWTLPANQAVAIAPEENYALIKCGEDDYLIIVEPLVNAVLERYGMSDSKVIAKVRGAKLVGALLNHPFNERTVPVVAAEHVTTESGTGAVHIAPAHGQEDYLVGIQYQLSLVNPVGDDGCYTADTPIFAGVHVNKANSLVIEELQKRDNLLHAAKLTHSYPHCWRHKTPLIFRATPQWFISMEKHQLRQQAMKAISDVQWLPDWGRNRISAMVESSPDWCISRQRAWGVPITIFIDKTTGAMHPKTTELMEHVAKKVEQYGIDAWFDLDPAELLGADAERYQKCLDVLDVWFDSGSVHEGVSRVRPELRFPADLYLEGSDQHRGWFQSSLMTSVAINEVAPYQTVLTHGYVVDNQKRKMSKSLGNVIAPEQIIQSSGADVLRLWVSAIDYRDDMAVSDETFTRTSDVYRRIRNTARFLLSNLAGFDPAKDIVADDDMLALDRWVVAEARAMQEEIIKAYDAFQFHIVYQKLQQFCALDLGGFYLDIIKDRQYTTAKNSLARRSTQTAMFHILEALVRWMAPILTFTAEEIWSYMPGSRAESVFLTTWYTHLPALPTQAAMNMAYWEKIRVVRDAVNKEIENLRNQGALGSSLEAEVTLYVDPDLMRSLNLLADELRFVLLTATAQLQPLGERYASAVATSLPNVWLKISRTTAAKCERCWQRVADVGQNTQHPTLCTRCVTNIEGVGENRQYA